MEYVTAVEISKLWNISSRMAAYYCEGGRIPDAVKKGKVWLIPANAEKPADRRFTKQKVKNRNKIQGVPYDGEDFVGDAIYHTSDVCHNLGSTRETLRYYEEIGLIAPKRSKGSQYRAFDLYDISRLLAIDFLRKRGFSAAEIRDLQETEETDEYSKAIQEKINDLHERMDDLNETLDKLQKAQNFLTALEHPLEFTVREMPPYYIQERLDSAMSFIEYKDKVLSGVNTIKEDILSNMVRAMTFDENGYLSSEVYVVKPGGTGKQSRKETLLDYGKCLYTTFAVDIDDISVPKRMFTICNEWAKQHHAAFRGVVYIFIRFVMLQGRKEQYCHEMWAPLRE